MKPCVINSSCPSAKAKHAEWCRVGRWAVVILFQDLQNPKQTESESLYIECHANPNVTVHMLLCWCHVLGLVMTCIDPRAVQSWQMCVTKPRNMVEDEFVWKFENKMRNKIVVEHGWSSCDGRGGLRTNHDQHWSTTILFLIWTLPYVKFVDGRGQVCEHTDPGQGERSGAESHGVAPAPWPLLLDVGWGSHFLEAMQCNTI